MAIFHFFGENEHRVFNYKPIYFDPEKEELKRRFGSVDGSLEKEKTAGTYVPGSHIKGAFRDGEFERRKGHLGKTQTIIGIISLLLIVTILLFIAKFYSLL